MSDTKENEETGQGVPLAVEENQQLVDATVEVQPEAAPAPVMVVENSNHVENGKAEAVSEGTRQEIASANEPPSEDKNVKLDTVSEGIPQEVVNSTLHSVPVEADAQVLNTTECEGASDAKVAAGELIQSNKSVEKDDSVHQNSVEKDGNVHQNGVEKDGNVHQNGVENDGNVHLNNVENDDNVHPNSVGDVETAVEVKPEVCEGADSKICDNGDSMPSTHNEPTTPQPDPAETKPEIKNVLEVENKADEKQAAEPADNGNSNSKHMCFLDPDHSYDGNESGTDEEQLAFMKELENFFRERSMEFKPPKFYGEGLNCLKLWRAVTRLGGYDKVTSCKLWRQVGESFKPPKTCTTVSWTFRGFYEKALLDYERHKIKGGELNVPIASQQEPMNVENQASASGRARRDAAARAMQGWHSQRLLGNGEVSDPIIKDRNSVSVQKREKQLKSINLLKRKKPSYMDNAVKAARSKPSKPQLDTAVVDIGPPADWVKINVQKTKDCFEVYALVPGLLREEVRVQSDPAGRLVISGEPEHPNNPWGVTPFKKVVSLPSRIDPHQTSAVVTLHGQLFVRVPFEQSE